MLLSHQRCCFVARFICGGNCSVAFAVATLFEYTFSLCFPCIWQLSGLQLIVHTSCCLRGVPITYFCAIFHICLALLVFNVSRCIRAFSRRLGLFVGALGVVFRGSWVLILVPWSWHGVLGALAFSTFIKFQHGAWPIYCLIIFELSLAEGGFAQTGPGIVQPGLQSDQVPTMWFSVHWIQHRNCFAQIGSVPFALLLFSLLPSPLALPFSLFSCLLSSLSLSLSLFRLSCASVLVIYSIQLRSAALQAVVCGGHPRKICHAYSYACGGHIASSWVSRSYLHVIWLVYSQGISVVYSRMCALPACLCVHVCVQFIRAHTRCMFVFLSLRSAFLSLLACLLRVCVCVLSLSLSFACCVRLLAYLCLSRPCFCLCGGVCASMFHVLTFHVFIDVPLYVVWPQCRPTLVILPCFPAPPLAIVGLRQGIVLWQSLLPRYFCIHVPHILQHAAGGGGLYLQVRWWARCGGTL